MSEILVFDIDKWTKEFVFSFSALKPVEETDIFTIDGLDFKFSFKTNFKNNNSFVIQVTSVSSEFGITTLTIVDQHSSGNNCVYKKKGSLSGNKTPCKLKIKCKDIPKFVENNQLIIRFGFKKQEKTASSQVGGQRREKNQMYGNIMHNIYNSRLATGFVGLRNDNSTCYMNSLLQTLFNIPSFRRIIYNADQNDEIDIKSNIMKNIQILFYNLQTSQSTCSTSPLRTSFGWTVDNFYQEDVHEFFSLFLDKIIGKFKSPEKRGEVESLFKFRIQSTIINKAYNFQKALPYDDQATFSLYIKSKTNIQDMINERLSSEMEYTVPGVGEVPCLVTESFISLPHILFIHIIRLDFDKEKNERFRINTPITYQERIIIPFQNEKVEYVLHGILNHLSRDAYFGHYVATLRPTTKDEWFSFNDSHVNRVSSNQAFNYKEECYVLVYARSDTEEVDFKEVQNDEIPEKVKEIAENSSFDVIHVPFITIANVEQCSENFKTINSSRKESITVPIGTSDSTSSMYSTIQETLGIPSEQMTLWECRYNGTPQSVIPNDNNIKANSYIKNRNPIFIQNGTTKENEILTIIKYFDAINNKLQVIDAIGLLKTTKPSDLFLQIESNVQSKSTNGFCVFHEPPENQNDPIQIDTSTELSNIEKFENGSTLIFEIKQPPLISESSNNGELLSFYNEKEKLYPLYLSMIKSSVTADLSISEDPNETFPIKYPSDFTYSDLKSFISPILGIPYDENDENNGTIVLFFQTGHDYFNNSLQCKNNNRQPLSPTPCYFDDDRIPLGHRPVIYTPKIMVKYLPDEKESDVKEKMKAFIVYTSEDSFNISKIDFAIEPKDSKISDIVQKFQTNENTSTKVSLMSSGRIQKLADLNSTIDKALGNNDYIIRIDEVFEDQAENQKTLIVNICVDKRDNSDRFEKHMSFYLPIIKGEMFSDTKARIMIISEIDEKDFTSLRFEMYSKFRDTENNSSPPKCPNLKNDLVLSDVDIPELCIEVLRPNISHSSEHVPIIYN